MNEVNAALENPSVWNEPKRAQELGKEKKQLDDVVLVLQDLDRDLADNLELSERSQEDGDLDPFIEASLKQGV